MARLRPCRHRRAALVLLLGLAACAQPPVPERVERVVEPRTTDAPAARGAGMLRTAMIAGHDAARRAVGVAPIAWDEALAADAQDHARAMARSRRFAHADQPQGPARQGENLWTGTRGAYAYPEMIGHWIAERRDFVDAPTPGFSRTGRWQDVAHYSQIVWRGSTRFGCATASNDRDDYLVCRYAPAGNVVGQAAY